jgi:hypothetical protein
MLSAGVSAAPAMAIASLTTAEYTQIVFTYKDRADRMLKALALRQHQHWMNRCANDERSRGD